MAARPYDDVNAPSARTDRIDLDAIVREMARRPAPAVPVVPSMVLVRRSSAWRSALTIAGVAALVGVGGGTGAVLVFTFLHPTTETAALEAVPVSEDVLAATTVPAPARPIAAAAGAQPAAEEAPARRRSASSERRARSGAEARRSRAETAPRSIAPVRIVSSRRDRRRAAEAAPPPADPAPVAPSPDVPERPSREDVERAMGGVIGSIRQCAPGMGVVHLDLRFAPTGRAAWASVDAPPSVNAGQRSCIARAARAAAVPRFGGEPLRVRYPVHL